MKKIAAFFDIDGTIYREGLITVRPAYLLWDKRQGDYDTYLLKMVDIYVEAIKGISKEQIEHVAKKVIEQKGDRVYTFSRERIKWHQDQGHIVIAISGSPYELVKEMSQKYNMDDFKGTIYKSDENNNYTGDVIPMWDSESKQKALLEMKEKYDIDLSASYAYGDTAGDYTMFKLVGIPYAINPTKELLNKITNDKEINDKINIIVERKDVTYKLTTTNLELL